MKNTTLYRLKLDEMLKPGSAQLPEGYPAKMEGLDSDIIWGVEDQG